MSLTASTVPATPWFNSGSISFSELRNNFKEITSGEVKASELIRDTSTSLTNPIVPDATENANVASSQSNWKTSQFRDTIKYYNLNQPSSDTDTNLNIAAAGLWNSNLGKNIVKTITLEGTSGSSTTGTAAASLDASAVYNVLLIITGSILGDGGSGASAGGNGGNGGPALYINTNSTGTVTVRTSGSSAQVYGGGGGGGGGGRGGYGGTGYYYTYYTYYTSTGSVTGYYGGSYDQQCRSACESIGAQWANNCYKIPGQGGCGGNSGDYWSAVCYSNDASGYTNVTSCKKTNSGSTFNAPTSGGAPGAATVGGNGRGYLQSKSNGGSVNYGTAGGANAGYGGRSGAGGNGGDWGEGGSTYNGEDGVVGYNGGYGTAPTSGSLGPISGGAGGAAGAAVSGFGYTIDSTNGVDSAYKGSK